MHWKYEDDTTKAVLTASAHVESSNGDTNSIQLPNIAILFFMHSGVDYLVKKYNCPLIIEKLPRFLQGCPVYQLNDDICFLDGGRGAPQAVDTVETLSVLGVKTILSVGMFGAFDNQVDIGDIVVPMKAFVEEGTSLHYYESIEFAEPDEVLARIAVSLTSGKLLSIVSTDAIYRQTFYKEQLWREKNTVGVDMETSAVLSVSKYLGIKAAAILMASDKHPENENSPKWKWHMTHEMRYDLFEKARTIAEAIQKAGL